MAAKTRNISTLIESQLPGFINEDYSKFKTFIEKYYEQQELRGQPLDIISNITKYRNIDFYDQKILNEKTLLSSSINNSDTTITVEDATSFPEKNGYIKIDDEICFYKNRTNNQFLEVSRGVSGNSTLGDLYNKSEFVTTESTAHTINAEVLNISNLFLYAFVRNFENEYLGSFPEKYLRGNIDKRTLIKNIADFYQAKGTDRSIKFLFNTIISRDPEEEVSVYAPKDNTLKASTSDWSSSYIIKIRSISGNPKKLIGNKISQGQVTAVIDNVTGSGNNWELTLSPDSITGEFEVSSRTELRKGLPLNYDAGDKITVFSTQGFPQKGYLLIGREKIYYGSKTINQFTITSRDPGIVNFAPGTFVYTDNTVIGTHPEGIVEFLIEGVVFNLLPRNNAPYFVKGDKIQEKTDGFDTNSPIIKSKRSIDFNQTRWFLNTSYTEVNSIHPNVNNKLNNVLSDVSAIFEDDLYYYICSSSYPSSQNLLTAETNVDLKDQESLKLIRKNPIQTTEIYEIGNKDVGILVDGSPLYSNKSQEEVVFGKIQEVSITAKGRNYKVPPIVLIDEQPGKARAILSGETVQSIVIEDNSVYESDPNIRITSGENAKLTAVVTNGEVTSLKIDNPGRYYTSPPIIVITDISGKGNFAEYEAIVNSKGQITNCVKINGGKLYNNELTSVVVIADGVGATATAKVRRWAKDRYKLISSEVDLNNGYPIQSNTRIGYGYGVVGNPKVLRRRIGDNISSGYNEQSSGSVTINGAQYNTYEYHSPVIGYAYDGNPIYGPYGYSDPLNSTSDIIRMRSGYVLKSSRPEGPSIIKYPLGTFVDDYAWVPSNLSGSIELDQNNGRFCVTPEYPKGTYAYFITIEELSGNPVFPYTLGKNFYSLPVDSNYNRPISQKDLPQDVKRFDTSDYVSSGRGLVGFIEEVSSGSVESAYVVDSTENFEVGSQIVTENANVTGFVSSLKGKNVVTIESEEVKAFELITNETAYLFAGDILRQTDPDTGSIYSAEVLFDVISGTNIVVRNTNYVFRPDTPFSSETVVERFILDTSSSYTSGSEIQCIDIEAKQVIGVGEVLESTISQNSVIVKILSGQFLTGSNYYIKSNTLSDTSRSEIISITSLSQNLTIFNINDSIAILETDTSHGVSVGDFIDVNIDPDNNTTETTYFVRKKLYQNIQTIPVTHNSVILDTGIGSGDVIGTGFSYGSGIYENIELIFQDSNLARPGIGRPGDPNNARATIIVGNPTGVGYGPVSSVIITNKGSGYRKEDRVTFLEDDQIFNIDPGNTQRFAFIVDHVGFAETNELLYLSNTTNLSAGDYLKVGNEIVEITTVDTANKAVRVIRGRKGTQAVNHYNGNSVTIEEAPFRFTENYRPFADGANQPILKSYDPETGKIIISYDYSDDPDLITRIQRNTVFFDESSPKKVVTLSSADDVSYKLELSKDDESNFIVNPSIDLLKLYSYKFDVSHISMLDTYLDISPSINYNIITESKESSLISPGNPGSFLRIRFGFGPNIFNNGTSSAEKIDLLRFSAYYYFIKAFGVDTEEAKINVVNDPLSGKKKVTYKSDTKLVYNLDQPVVYDGSGSITYTTESTSATGKINNISISNGGLGIKTLPLVKGVFPKKNNKAIVEAKLDPITGSLIQLDQISSGFGYVNPKIVIDGDGSGAVIGLSTSSTGAVSCYIQNKGKGYSYINLSIVEGDVDIYLESTTIGVPKTVSIILSGSGYTKDFTTTPRFQSPTILVLDSAAGLELTTDIIQPSSGATATISLGGWRPGSNVVKLENVKGEFVVGEIIKSPIRNSFATVKSVVVTNFVEEIKSYKIIGDFLSNKGKLNDSNQKIQDSYFYQDYSYVVESDTSVNDWRDLVLETTHPAGFQLFGEVNVKSSGIVPMPEANQKVIETLCNLSVTIEQVDSLNTSRVVTTTLSKFEDINIFNGVGGISVSDVDLTDTYVREIELSGTFDGVLDLDTFKRIGTQSFMLYEKGTTFPINPVNEQQLIITIDGILQEPGESYTVSGNTITFTEPPLGQRISEGQLVPAQKFYGKSFRYVSSADNDRYLRKIKNISNQFDNIRSDFDLYYTDDTPVKTDVNENLFVVIDGVKQIFNESYTIQRFEDLSIPDKIVFTSKPEVEDSVYVSNDPRENEVLRVEQKSFIYTVGNYFSATINPEIIKSKPKGPFLILDKNNQRVVNVPDDIYALVFVDNVLQTPGKAYNIFGSFISFTSNLPYSNKEGDFVYPKIEIIYVYGKSTRSVLTLHNFESSVYLRDITVTASGGEFDLNFFAWEAEGPRSDLFQKDYLYAIDADRSNPQDFIVNKYLESVSPVPPAIGTLPTTFISRFYSPVTQTFVVTTEINPSPLPNYITSIDGVQNAPLTLSSGNTYRFDISDPSLLVPDSFALVFVNEFGFDIDPDLYIQEKVGEYGSPNSYIYFVIKSDASTDNLVYTTVTDFMNDMGMITVEDQTIAGQDRTPFNAKIVFNGISPNAEITPYGNSSFEWEEGDLFVSNYQNYVVDYTIAARFNTIVTYTVGIDELPLGKVESIKKYQDSIKFRLESNTNWSNENLEDRLLVYKKFNYRKGSYSYLINGSYVLSSSEKSVNGRNILRRNTTYWLDGERDDKAYYERTKTFANLHPNDEILIAGESSFRKVLEIPREAFKLDYRDGKIISEGQYTNILTTPYNGVQFGQQLSISVELENGSVSKINWNKNEFDTFFNQRTTSSAVGYTDTPQIYFIPKTPAGGGAKAAVFYRNGTVWSIDLIDGGSGYEVPPLVVVAKPYKVKKDPSRRLQSLSVINFSLDVNPSLTSVTTILRDAVAPDIISDANLIIILAGIAVQQITTIIEPDEGFVSFEVEEDILPFYYAVSIESFGDDVARFEIDINEFFVRTELQSVQDPFVLERNETYIEYEYQILTSEIFLTAGTSQSDTYAILDADFLIGDTVLYVSNTKGFPDSGRIQIEYETVSYEGREDDRFYISTRGDLGTLEDNHPAGSYVRFVPDLLTVAPIDIEQGIESFIYEYQVRAENTYRAITSTLQTINNASLISVDREFVSIISPVQEVLIVGILTEGLDSGVITIEEDYLSSVIDIEIITGGLQDSYRRITTFVEPEDQLITIDFGIRKFDRFDNLYVSDIDFEYQPKIQPYSNLGVSWQILRYLDVLERTDLNTANISTERVEVWIQPEDQQVAMSANTDTMVIVSIDYFDIQVGLEDIRAEFQSGGIIVVPGAIIPIEIEAFVIMPNITNVEVFIIPFALRFDDVIKAPLNIIKEWIRPFWDSNIGSPIFDNFGGSIVDSDFEIFIYRRLWTTFVELGDGRGSAGVQNFNIEITQIPISIDPEEEIIRFQQYLVTPLSVEQRWVRNWWDRDGELANASVANIEYLHQLTTIYDDLFEDVKLAGTDLSSDREIISVINPVDEVTVVDVTQDIISRIRFETIGESLDLQSDAKIWSLVYFRTEAEAGTDLSSDREIIFVINPVDEVTVVDVTPDFINKVQLETIDGGSLDLQSDAKIWSSIYFRTEVEAGTGFFVDKEIVSVISPVQEVLIVGVSTEGLETSFVRIEQDFFGLIEIRTIDAGSLTPQTDLQIWDLLYFRSSRIATITDISFIYDEIRPIQISDEVAFEYSIVHNDRRDIIPQILVDLSTEIEPIDRYKTIEPLRFVGTDLGAVGEYISTISPVEIVGVLVDIDIISVEGDDLVSVIQIETIDGGSLDLQSDAKIWSLVYFRTEAEAGTGFFVDKEIVSVISPVQEILLVGVLVDGLDSDIISIEEDDLVSVIQIETIDSGFTTGAQQVTFSYDRIIPVQNEFLIEFTEQKEIGRILQPQILGDSIVSITKEIFFSGSKNNGQELFVDFGLQTSVVETEFEIFYYVNLWSGGATLRGGEEPVDELGFPDLRLDTPFVGENLSHEVEDFFRYLIPQVPYGEEFNVYQEIIRNYPNQHLLPNGDLDETEGLYVEATMPSQAFSFEIFYTETVPGPGEGDDPFIQTIIPRSVAIVSLEFNNFNRVIETIIDPGFNVYQEIYRYYPNFHLDPISGDPDPEEGLYAQFEGTSVVNIFSLIGDIPDDPDFDPAVFKEFISEFDVTIEDIVQNNTRVITPNINVEADIFGEYIKGFNSIPDIPDALELSSDTDDTRLNTIVEINYQNTSVAQPTEVENTNIVYTTSTGIADSIANELGGRYFRSTLGMTYRMYERNAFLTNGTLNVNASMSFTLDRFQVGEFEERDNSSISANAETFNLGIPSINEVGTILASDLLIGETTITTAAILDGPNSLYPTSGRLLIGSSVGSGVEEVTYTGISGNQFTGVTRSVQGNEIDHIIPIDPKTPVYVITIG